MIPERIIQDHNKNRIKTKGSFGIIIIKYHLNPYECSRSLPNLQIVTGKDFSLDSYLMGNNKNVIGNSDRLTSFKKLILADSLF
jgi:hypothetical protein